MNVFTSSNVPIICVKDLLVQNVYSPYIITIPTTFFAIPHHSHYWTETEQTFTFELLPNKQEVEHLNELSGSVGVECKDGNDTVSSFPCLCW
jgi:hypothetical protein